MQIYREIDCFFFNIFSFTCVLVIILPRK